VLSGLRLSRAGRPPGLEHRLPLLRLPTLFVCGEDHPFTPPSVAERLHQHTPRSTMFVLRRCGPAPWTEQPWAFGRVVRAWVEETWPLPLGV
jgi:pimeloyl-ACP methyl ester carboxylesterase